ncbi:MAG TPA: dihydroorotase [Oscillospiraceae bacterium]|nr:dihydroorotase [Oscillospiraceae bacterium]
MKYILKNAFVFLNGCFSKNDVFIESGVISNISPYVSPEEGTLIYDLNNCYIFPGLLDAHVHLREPGFSYKETIKSGTLAAAKGGFTGVCAMPNLSPVPDSLSNLNIELELIKKDAMIEVYPIGAITVSQDGKQLSDMESMAPFVIGFSDDGKGVNDSELMLQAMKTAKKLDKPIIAHCEDLTYGGEGVINDCDYARRHNLPAITSESEWKAVENDIRLLKKADCAYHVCHVSTKKSVALIRDAKKQGLNITSETAPHYLFLNDTMLKDSGNFKMNPPIRGKSDRTALLEGLLDGTIDMIATDHAPHSAAEKSKGLLGSSMGVTGIELSFSLCYTNLVKTGILPLEKLLCLMHENPKNRFGIGSSLIKGSAANLTVFDLSKNYKIDANSLISKGKSTPFLGESVFAKCVMTMFGGRIIWS